MSEESQDASADRARDRLDASKQKVAWDPVTHIESAQATARFKTGGGKRSELFVVTSVRAWIALALFVLLITGIIIWVFTGHVVEVVSGDGVQRRAEMMTRRALGGDKIPKYCKLYDSATVSYYWYENATSGLRLALDVSGVAQRN